MMQDQSPPNCPEDERRGLAVAPLRFAGIRGQRLPASIAVHKQSM